MKTRPRKGVAGEFCLCELGEWLDGLPGGKRNRWVAWESLPFVPRTGICGADEEGLVTAGWNGSYHDAWYDSLAAMTGPSPSRARKKLQRLLRELEGVKEGDSAALRMGARAARYQGD